MKYSKLFEFYTAHEIEHFNRLVNVSIQQIKLSKMIEIQRDQVIAGEKHKSKFHQHNMSQSEPAKWIWCLKLIYFEHKCEQIA